MAGTIAPADSMGAHVGCGDVLTADTTLDSDLVNCTSFGLIVGAGGITVDLGGHVVDGTPLGGTGIASFGEDAVTVRNGVVREFSVGIRMAAGSTGSTLDMLELRDNLNYGAELVGSHDNVLTKVYAHSNRSNGIRLDAAHRNRVESSNLSRNGSLLDHTSGGLLAERSEENVVAGNTLTANPFNGISFRDLLTLDAGDSNAVIENRVEGGINAISLFGTSDSSVSRNVVSGAGIAVQLIQSPRVSVAGNSFTTNGTAVDVTGNLEGPEAIQVVGNDIVGGVAGVIISRVEGATVAENSVQVGGTGIRLRFARDNRILDNSIRGGQWGIESRDSQGNRYEGNRVRDAEVDGMELLESEAIVLANFALKNRDDGIDVAGGASTVGRNKANGNGDLGIEAVPDTIDAGGNKASANGNPLQCLNISCK